MKYINKLVQTWSASGITTEEKARAEAEKHKTAGKTEPKKPGRSYDQREIKDEEFENGYYMDLSKYSGDDFK